MEHTMRRASSPPIAPAHHVRAETPVAFVQAIVRAYLRRGMDPAAALTKAQIAPHTLENPHNRITALQMEWVSAAAMQELDDEALGWFERRLPWGSYGMLVRASLTAPTLGVALGRWCRHHGLLTGQIALSLTQERGVATLTLTELQPLGDMQEFCVVSVLRNALGVACWLTDSRIPLRATRLGFAAPPHACSYSILFDGPTTFGASRHSLEFDAGYLALPVRRNEAALAKMLQRALLLTVRPYRRDRLLVDKVRQALTQHPDLHRNAESLAQTLAMSTRTLHRQLRDEGESLQTIRDSVRRGIACELLVRSRKPIKQVAQAAGFDNDKSFMRAFKGWTGVTPDEFRAQDSTSVRY
jgi:AraC-like DNA-binding protein